MGKVMSWWLALPLEPFDALVMVLAVAWPRSSLGPIVVVGFTDDQASNPFNLESGTHLSTHCHFFPPVYLAHLYDCGGLRGHWCMRERDEDGCG